MANALLAAGARPASPTATACAAARGGGNGNARVIERLLTAGADVQHGAAGWRDGADDGGAHWRADAVQALVAAGADVNALLKAGRADSAHVGRGREQRGGRPGADRGGADMARVERRRSRRFCSPCEPGTSMRPASFSTPEPRSNERAARRHERAGSGDPTPTTSSRRPARSGADPNAGTQGWTALHQVAWTRRPNRSTSRAPYRRATSTPGPREAARRPRRRPQRATRRRSRATAIGTS